MTSSEENQPVSSFPLSVALTDLCIQCDDRKPLAGSEVCGACHRSGQVCETCGKPTNGESAFCRNCRTKQDEARQADRQADLLIAKLGVKLDELIERKVAARLAA